MEFSRNTLIIMLFLSGTLTATKLSENRKPDVLAQHLDAIPSSVDGWQGISLPAPPDSVQAKLVATEFLSRLYKRDKVNLEFWVAYYADQKAGESMHSPKACLPGAGWEPVDYGFVSVPLPWRAPVTANRYLVEKGREKLQVLYWYQTKQRVIASEYSGKAFLVWDSILGRSTGGMLVRISMPDQPGALDNEIKFASLAVPLVEACLRQGAGSAEVK